MAATICPTVTAYTADEYDAQMNRIAQFAVRIHIDLCDGIFTPTKTVPIDYVWWPGGVRADIHIMYQKPFEHYKKLLALSPQMVIIHSEAEGGNFQAFSQLLHNHGIEVGVAIKAETAAELIRPALEWIDYVLVFSGSLGRFGGTADLSLLSKVEKLRAWKPQLEIGWDGGINNQNVASLAANGVDVLNVGGFIQHAADPKEAYDWLDRLITHPVVPYDRPLY